MKRAKLDMITVELTDEQRKALMDEIHSFFLSEYGDDMGMIKQQRILELFTEKLASVIYNKALDDAMLWYKRQQDNLEADYYSLYKDL